MRLSAEQREIRSLAREFTERELRPHSPEWDAARALDPGVFGQLGELGFLGMTVPGEHGGLGLDPLTYLVVLEELARGDAAVALAVSVHNGPVASLLARHGTEVQQRALLPALAAGERVGAFALSEPLAGSLAGSDVSAVAARAHPDGTGWRLTGTKRWVTNGERAGLAVVFARTAERALGAFLVELPADGWRVTHRERTMGLCASETVTVELEGVRVPHDRVLGNPTGGLSLALEALDVGRLGAAALAVGLAQAALEHAASYARQREQFGRPIAAFGGIQEKLAEMARRVTVARAVTHAGAARLADAALAGGQDAAEPDLDGVAAWAAIAKLTAGEAAMWVTDEAVQVFGGYGYMREYPVEKLMRDAKGTEIFEGTSEILRVGIARALMRDHQ